MGRPRRHNEQTAEALLDAAERLVETEGAAALSVRRVAHEIGTTTRAVYSVYGSKDALLAALGRRAFEILGREIARLPATDDPAGDLVEAGVVVFRRFVVEHPSLFRIGFLHTALTAPVVAEFRPAASDALGGLFARVQRLADADLLGGRSARDATFQFDVLCEGLAVAEVRGNVAGEGGWRDALNVLVRGWAGAPLRGDGIRGTEAASDPLPRPAPSRRTVRTR
jgi:AcrR family transcriptional regulator